MTRFFLLISLISLMSCSKKELTPLQSQFSMYCQYVTDIVEIKEKATQNPKLILLGLGKIIPKLGEEFKFVMSTQSVILKERRYESFVFLGRKVFKDERWDCPAYEYFSQNFLR